MVPAVIIHGGAGPYGRHLADNEGEYRRALRDVIENAGSMVERGDPAMRVVTVAVSQLEELPMFNAGRGAALCADGTAELSAAVMRGTNRQAGAVAGITRVRSPVTAALIVFAGREVLRIGEAADRLAIEQRAEQVPRSYFVTERQLTKLADRDHGDAGDRGTVGAVCLDRDGVLAAATSTGGVSGQPPGRVGDSPLIGAGTWADERVAVSCTGDGEAFVRAGAARHLATLVECGAELAVAADRALAEVGRCEGTGGLIALSAGGEFTTPHTTETMLHAIWRAGSDPEVRIPQPPRR